MTAQTAQPPAADPAAKAASLTVTVDAATRRILRSAAALSDQQAREPSLLPGWSRGHVLTHVARNADSLRNLLIWARTGVVTPQYPDQETRNRDIEAGAGRPAGDLAEDIERSAAALAEEGASLAGEDWAAEVAGLRGNSHPAWYTLWRRLSEVEIHHVDLAAGYGPADWPEAFAAHCLERVVDSFSGPHCPSVRLRITESGSEYVIGLADTEPITMVLGPTRTLLAWLIGRTTGDGLAAEPAGPLPKLPPW